MARLTSKGQVTIPREVRERLGLEPGTEVSFEVEGETVLMRRHVESEAIARWAGVLEIPEGVDEFLDAARGER